MQFLSDVGYVPALGQGASADTILVRDASAGNSLLGLTIGEGLDVVSGSLFVDYATATTKGGVELFSNTTQTVAANAVSATASRTYGLQLDAQGRAVVNVPWVEGGSGTIGGTIGSGGLIPYSTGADTIGGETGFSYNASNNTFTVSIINSSTIVNTGQFESANIKMTNSPADASFSTSRLVVRDASGNFELLTAAGTSTGRYLKDDGTFDTPSGGTIGGAITAASRVAFGNGTANEITDSASLTYDDVTNKRLELSDSGKTGHINPGWVYVSNDGTSGSDNIGFSSSNLSTSGQSYFIADSTNSRAYVRLTGGGDDAYITFRAGSSSHTWSSGLDRSTSEYKINYSATSAITPSQGINAFRITTAGNAYFSDYVTMTAGTSGLGLRINGTTTDATNQSNIQLSRSNGAIAAFIGHTGDANLRFNNYEVGDIIFGSNTETRLRVLESGQIQIPQYITNAFTGTVHNWLAVDTSGNIVEVSAPVAGGSMDDWTLRADAGTDATISDATIVDIAGGTNLSTSISGSTVTVNMDTGGAGAATYGSINNDVKIDQITLDAYGRVTSITTGATGSGNGTMSSFNVQANGGTQVAVTNTEEVNFINGNNTTAVVTNQTNPTVTFNLSIATGVQNSDEPIPFIEGSSLLRYDSGGIFTFNPSTNLFRAGVTRLEHSGGGEMLVLRDTGTTVEATANPYIRFQYNTGTNLGYLGYGSSSNDALYLYNQVGETLIYADNALSATFTSGTVTATTFSGALSGNATTATTLATARTINGVSFNGSANITVEPYISNDDTGDTNCPIVFTANSTQGYKRLYEDSSLYIDNTNNRIYIGNGSSTNGSSHQMIMFYNDVATRPSAIGAYRGTVNYTGISFWTSNNAAQTERMRLSSAGQLDVDANVVAYSSSVSDIRVKENINKLDSKQALKTILSLDAIDYTHKFKNKDKLHSGYIAQDFEKELPHLIDELSVLGQEDWGFEAEDKIKTINYTEVIPYITEAMKEQQREIEELKELVKQLINDKKNG